MKLRGLSIVLRYRTWNDYWGKRGFGLTGEMREWRNLDWKCRFMDICEIQLWFPSFSRRRGIPENRTSYIGGMSWSSLLMATLREQGSAAFPNLPPPTPAGKCSESTDGSHWQPPNILRGPKQHGRKEVWNKEGGISERCVPELNLQAWEKEWPLSKPLSRWHRHCTAQDSTRLIKRRALSAASPRGD